MKNLFIILVAIGILTAGLAKAQEKVNHKKGYFNLTELGYYPGNNFYSFSNKPNVINEILDGAKAFSIRNINGWFITPKISLGIGLGLENYTLASDTEGLRKSYNNLFLLFADARYYFYNRGNTFFAYGNAGGSVAIKNFTDKGPMLGFGFGYKFKAADAAALSASVGFNDQIITMPNVLKNSYRCFAIRVGLLF